MTFKENALLRSKLTEATDASIVIEDAELKPDSQIKLEQLAGKALPPSLQKQEVKKKIDKVQEIAGDFFENPTAKNGCAILRQYADAKDYPKAFELSKILIERLIRSHFKGKAQHNLIALFSDFSKLKIDDLTKPFYGWILFALTWNEAKKCKDIEKILSKYERAAIFGCSIASYYKAMLLQNAGRENEAIKEWERCIDLFGDEACSKDAAEELVQLLETKAVETPDQRNRIIELYKKAESANGFYNLGFIFQKGWASTSHDHVIHFDDHLIDLPLAESYFRKSQEWAPDEIDTITAIAETIMADKTRLTKDRCQEAMDLYQMAIDQGSKEAIYLRALVYLDENNQDAAISELKKLDINPACAASDSDAIIHKDALLKLAMLHAGTDAQSDYLQRAMSFKQ